MTDCLVFKLEEFEEDRDKMDNVIYILYDTYDETYIIRGRREETRTRAACTYSFACDDENDLADFLQYTICSHNTVNEILYNYDNLPYDSWRGTMTPFTRFPGTTDKNFAERSCLETCEC